jgi:hypothetical protein
MKQNIYKEKSIKKDMKNLMDFLFGRIRMNLAIKRYEREGIEWQ